MKKERLVDINVTVNVDAIRAAASNAAKVQEIALEVPVVDPKDLSIDDQIFGLELLPVNDKAKKNNPDTAMYTAIKPIVVDTLSGRAKPGFITVNGTIDIPKEGGRVNKVEDCFFTKQEDARAVCRIITEVELDRSLERLENEQKNADFLKKQLEDDRF
jgi:hypothetical protein